MNKRVGLLQQQVVRMQGALRFRPPRLSLGQFSIGGMCEDQRARFIMCKRREDVAEARMHVLRLT